MSKTSIIFSECSEEVVNEINRLTRVAMREAAQVIVDEAKRNIKGYTGQLADGLVVQKEEEMFIDNEKGWNILYFGYLTPNSFKKNIRKGTYYPNPYWVEEYGVQPHNIYTKQAREYLNGNEEIKFTYQLTDLHGNQYGYGVINPGATPKHYLRNAKNTKFNEVKQVLADGLKKVEEYEVKNAKTKKLL